MHVDLKMEHLTTIHYGATGLVSPLINYSKTNRKPANWRQIFAIKAFLSVLYIYISSLQVQIFHRYYILYMMIHDLIY